MLHLVEFLHDPLTLKLKSTSVCDRIYDNFVKNCSVNSVAHETTLRQHCRERWLALIEQINTISSHFKIWFTIDYQDIEDVSKLLITCLHEDHVTLVDWSLSVLTNADCRSTVYIVASDLKSPMMIVFILNRLGVTLLQCQLCSKISKRDYPQFWISLPQ